MKISSLDHIVLTVKDIEISCAFYHDILEMEIITFQDANGISRKSLTFGQQKFNLHQLGNEFEPKARNPTSGAIDLCLLTKTPIESVMKELQLHNISIEEGPIERTGALHKLLSVYIRDPDQNLIEIANSL